jgi:hypothetical protein
LGFVRRAVFLAGLGFSASAGGSAAASGSTSAGSGGASVSTGAVASTGSGFSVGFGRLGARRRRAGADPGETTASALRFKRSFFFR